MLSANAHDNIMLQLTDISVNKPAKDFQIRIFVFETLTECMRVGVGM